MKVTHLLTGLLIVAGLTLLSSCKASKEVQTYALSAANENLGSLTKITDNADQTPVSVSVDPTSSTLFISLKSSDGRICNIYKKDNPLSAAMTQITSGKVWTSACAYNPVNERLAFTYQTPIDGGWTKNDIYMIDLRSVNALIPITQTATISEYCPSISSDGKRLVYQAYGGSDGEIWIRDLNSNENILVGKGFNPAISSDGKKITFARYKTNSSNSPSAIWIMDVDGSNVQQLTNNSDEVAWAPHFSPDGKRIIYSSLVRGKKKDRDLYVINVDGTGLMQLTTNESYEDNPVWSKDGYIYFISDRGAKKGANQVWRFVAPK